MLTLDPSSETYRGPYHRAHPRRLRSLIAHRRVPMIGLGDDIRLWALFGPDRPGWSSVLEGKADCPVAHSDF